MQLPNPPLVLAMSSGLVAARTDGRARTGARAAFRAALAVWAWEEMRGGANVVRRAVGVAGLAYVAADVKHAHG